MTGGQATRHSLALSAWNQSVLQDFVFLQLGNSLAGGKRLGYVVGQTPIHTPPRGHSPKTELRNCHEHPSYCVFNHMEPIGFSQFVALPLGISRIGGLAMFKSDTLVDLQYRGISIIAIKYQSACPRFGSTIFTRLQTNVTQRANDNW